MTSMDITTQITPLLPHTGVATALRSSHIFKYALDCVPRALVWPILQPPA